MGFSDFDLYLEELWREFLQSVNTSVLVVQVHNTQALPMTY